MRKAVASIFCVLYTAMYISNIVFIHGHVTADGRVVMHVHPYDIAREKRGKKHHHSASETEMLNAVYYCTYLHTTLYCLPLFTPVLTGFIPVPENTGRPHLLYLMATTVRGPPLRAIDIAEQAVRILL
ncbi:MAG: hypothetical protein KF746_13480 [Chitinophagaceae bacterium]|nr:hypothetical protein [Chitinophagaceae bacterium]